MSEHRFEIGDRVLVSEAFPLPGYGLGKARDVVATVEELRTASGTGDAGYVVHWWGSDGPFASHRYAVAFDRHCEPIDV